MSYHKGNFFKHTYCVFKEVNLEDFPFKDEAPHFTSKSGSSYYYTKDGVYRVANHWGRAANCRWRLVATNELNDRSDRIYIGYAKWTMFYRDSEVEKLYCIAREGEIIGFKHKDELGVEGRIFRNASETQKVIRKIKAIMGRAKYLDETEMNLQIDKLIFI